MKANHNFIEPYHSGFEAVSDIKDSNNWAMKKIKYTRTLRIDDFPSAMQDALIYLDISFTVQVESKMEATKYHFSFLVTPDELFSVGGVYDEYAKVMRKIETERKTKSKTR